MMASVHSDATALESAIDLGVRSVGERELRVRGFESKRADHGETPSGRVCEVVDQGRELDTGCQRGDADEVELGGIGRGLFGAHQRSSPSLRMAGDDDVPRSSDTGEGCDGADAVEHRVSFGEPNRSGRRTRGAEALVVSGDEYRATFDLLPAERRKVVSDLV